MNAGECVHCGALNRLDDAGACPACASRAPCAKHPERPSVARCTACGQPFCRPCAPFGICEACAAAVPAAPIRLAPAPPEPPARGSSRRGFMFAALSVLGAGLGVLAARQLQAMQALGAQADQAARLQAVWAAAAKRRDAAGRWPAEPRAFAGDLPPGTVVLGPKDPPAPGAVVYEADGTGPRLKLYDAGGKLVERDGAVWVVTGF